MAPHVLDEAAEWLMRLHDSAATDADRRACERWRQSHPDHARAWARAELLMNKFGGLPSALAMPSLARPSGTGTGIGAGAGGRRAAIGRLAALLAAVPAGWLGWQLASERGWTAEHRTATGERRELRLADGTRLVLNTASAVDVRFDAAQRLVVLHAGEILITTAPDTAAVHRPFRVATGSGTAQALGTRFSVRKEDGATHIAVFEGAVRIAPRGAASRVVPAGQQARFRADAIDAATPADEAGVAWAQGMLLADGMRLADFAAELSRYRSGALQCDAAVANLRISGAFPIDDTDRVLQMLVSTYPVDAVTRLRGYWVTLVPRVETDAVTGAATGAASRSASRTAKNISTNG
ncbi:FecR domain-containing protein [Variovorax sp. J22G73]|uniref:FecR domain-containing protein n=1 Tax=unclassified Variovorax TaxID=663243 RepID=UPI002576E23B|nr:MULTISPECIES: FecR domain-containing protein [unclassified Variovorax]MDM0007266.1 FecR domain-containing protein [Variovorax sp. J22R203]MDM0098982.1 FecR domain-containing protein [Variovorax sp. J22G73]